MTTQVCERGKFLLSIYYDSGKGSIEFYNKVFTTIVEEEDFSQQALSSSATGSINNTTSLSSTTKKVQEMPSTRILPNYSNIEGVKLIGGVMKSTISAWGLKALIPRMLNQLVNKPLETVKPSAKSSATLKNLAQTQKTKQSNANKTKPKTTQNTLTEPENDLKTRLLDVKLEGHQGYEQTMTLMGIEKNEVEHLAGMRKEDYESYLRTYGSAQQRVKDVVDFSHYCLGDEGMDVVMESMLADGARFSVLLLRDNNLTDDGVVRACEQLEFDHRVALRVIDAGENNISKRGGEALYHLATKLPNLVEIRLDGCAVDEKTLEKIQAITAPRVESHKEIEMIPEEDESGREVKVAQDETEESDAGESVRKFDDFRRAPGDDVIQEDVIEDNYDDDNFDFK
eukprot:CAMPEP_0115014762 /NCGR_PEP_ID=MMETSP0216-20121206/26298_1 /TAXON_ID=223996 /ORGANISM="Protocruzia adherens, Strain Boccale" /LENGTH=397 /DNA_ID=CAMNT_0002384617 /DNA_START=44 /DNA_END=1235 /DNA_ORIENTATION=+